jgi:signal recognition particle receptor subunit beta
VDYFEERGIPFLVAVNQFDGARRYGADDVRMALDVDSVRPVVFCDARQRESVRQTLIALVQHALDMATDHVREPGFAGATGRPD